MDTESIGVACTCCGVPVHGERQRVRKCMMCDVCDGRHGDALQAHLVALVTQGRAKWGDAVAWLAIDNAHLWGSLLAFIPDGSNAIELRVPQQPRPWQVTIARAIARGETPSYDALIGACLAPFVPGPNTIERRQQIADEITTALCWLDADVVCADVAFENDTLDAGNLIIKVQVKQAVPGAVVFGDNAEIPQDIMNRARGQA